MNLLLSMLALFVSVACGEPETPFVAPSTQDAPQDLEPDASPKWKLAPGLEGVELPAAMVADRGRVFLFTADRVAEYLPEKRTWVPRVADLPREVGSGVAACSNGAGSIYVLAGGKSKAFWRFDVATSKIEVLPETPGAVGVGGAIAHDGDHDALFALRGDVSRDFWRHDLRTRTWTRLTRVGGETRLAAIGQSTGGIQYSRGVVYAWPDHHVQRYDLETGTWQRSVHMSYGQRPWWDGAAFARDTENDVWIVVQGMASRTLSLFDPNARRFAFLKPRLPVRITGEGSRAVIVEVAGEKTLLVYAAAQGNRMLSIALSDLGAVEPESPASDEGSPFVTLHERAGSSLVRRDAPKPVLGVMGRAGERWYFGRLKNIRFLDPETNAWTPYPGVPVGGLFDEGVCATWDGDRSVYVMNGGGTGFSRVDVAKMESEELPAAPKETRLGGKMAFLDGRLHVLFGGETRDHGVYDPASRTWKAGAPLPVAAAPVGAAGSALLVVDGALLAISGKVAWTLGEGGWTRRWDLPAALSADGGMAAWDEVAGKLHLIEGGGSRRLHVLTPGSPPEVALMMLPDVVSVVGDRALVDDVFGKRMLAVHRGHDTHEIFLLDVTTP